MERRPETGRFFYRSGTSLACGAVCMCAGDRLAGLVSLTQERGIWKEGMCTADLVAVLSECSDAHNTQPWVELIFKERNTRAFSHPEHTETCGHVCLFLPKCHPELHCKRANEAGELKGGDKAECMSPPERFIP